MAAVGHPLLVLAFTTAAKKSSLIMGLASTKPRYKKRRSVEKNGDTLSLPLAKGKKWKGDPSTERDNNAADKLVKIQIPSTLRKQLVDDWEFVNQQNKINKIEKTPTAPQHFVATHLKLNDDGENVLVAQKARDTMRDAIVVFKRPNNREYSGTPTTHGMKWWGKEGGQDIWGGRMRQIYIWVLQWGISSHNSVPTTLASPSPSPLSPSPVSSSPTVDNAELRNIMLAMQGNIMETKDDMKGVKASQQSLEACLSEFERWRDSMEARFGIAAENYAGMSQPSQSQQG